MTWGDKYSAQEVDDAFDNFEMDDRGFIDTAAVIEMLTGKSDMEGEAQVGSARRGKSVWRREECNS
ncbi:Myosin regulatory light chain 2 [Portunus trituberculatus]|uniref:Myosin regulatory light chain 2 n=1 Tax=Portunus trituberculatus TaxID=210409 RepID=A0A5B7JFI5_PORTR|nr:Myosin regulatory light chain 2 [Portunus trituberculatus]